MRPALLAAAFLVGLAAGRVVAAPPTLWGEPLAADSPLRGRAEAAP